ncbi:MAG: FAD-binding oxidoreductase [Candidatus Nomurabacteria bacterium]|nr:FAD-binding oxidoreductase [Candidatus Nomurabacteria bacterium]
MDFKNSQVPTLYKELARSLSGEIDVSHHSLEQHSRDASFCKITPHIITYPKTIDDIKKIISCADEYKIPISVKGNGRNASGASLAEGIVVDMTKYFNHIKHLDMSGNVINVDPGVNCKKIREHLSLWGLEIPFLTEQNDEDTIGGVVSTKNVSPTSFEHGGIGSWVTGLSIVLTNGEQHLIEEGITPSGKLLYIYQSLFPLLATETHIIRGSKPLCSEDNSGYNIWGQSIGPKQLINNIIGSQGTLVVITGIKLRIVPKRLFKKTTLIRIKDYYNLPDSILACKENGVDSLFMYDLLLENLSMGYDAHNKEIISSEVPHVLTLVATQSENDENILSEKQKRLIKALNLPPENTTCISGENQLCKLTEHNNIKKLLDTYGGNTVIPCITGGGIIVPIDDLPETLFDIEKYHNKNHLIFNITGNVGSGHISVITFIPNEVTSFANKIMETTEACFSIAKKYKGSGSALSGDGIIGTVFLPLFYPPKIIEIFSKIKNIWDPSNILNTGKKLNIDIQYVKQRISPINNN